MQVMFQWRFSFVLTMWWTVVKYGWRPRVDMWNEVVIAWQHLKLGYLLCVLHLLESGRDAFHNEIYLTFDDIDKYVNESMDMTIALCFKERHKGEHRFMYHERWFNLNRLGYSGDDTLVWLHCGIFLWRWLGGVIGEDDIDSWFLWGHGNSGWLDIDRTKDNSVSHFTLLVWGLGDERLWGRCLKFCSFCESYGLMVSWNCE